MSPIYVRIVNRRGIFRLPRIQEVNPVVWGFGTSLAIWSMSNGAASTSRPGTAQSEKSASLLYTNA
ncbi:uncharacterized protein PG986_011158 [Apiospora aurea]|uniref:Uncharacterized protein n=1 Tax=Apiospora aurea TaxID=335848 RepID=A0ABR1Q4H3_9PEZI